MRSHKFLSIITLFIFGLSFAGANVWFAAVRSTIPLALKGHIQQAQRLTEKTPGVDDVYFVTLDSGRRLHVDRSVFEAMAAHRSVEKRGWSQIIEIDGQKISLEWSPDFRGMIWAMPLTAAVCAFVGMISTKGLWR